MIRESLEWMVLFVLVTFIAVGMTPLVLCDGGIPRVSRLWSGWWHCLTEPDRQRARA